MTNKSLSVLDKFLTLWIFIAMGIGIGMGYLWPSVSEVLDAYKIHTISIPIAIGLLVMMYPPLAKVKYEELRNIVKAKNAKMVFGTSLALNWVIGPAIMFATAWIFLPDLPEFRIGIIMVGLARCIAMVLVWNHLAEGDPEYCAILVALNSLFQIFMYSFLAYFYITFVSGLIFGSSEHVNVSMTDIARSVFIFLGIPFIAGIITRFVLVRRKGRMWYDGYFVNRIGPIAMFGLLYTIVVMFAFKGLYIVERPIDVVRLGLPLLVYFLLMFFVSYYISYKLKFNYRIATTQAFTAASNNFELAIAVCIGIWGIGSLQAFAAVVGPLMEVPVLISLVNVALWFKKKYYGKDGLPKKSGCCNN